MKLDAFRSRFYHPDDAESVTAQALNAYTQGTPVWMDGRMIRADGEVIHARSRMSLYSGPNGERQFLGIVQDVTRQVHADQAVRLAAATLSEIIKYAPLGVVRISHDLTLLQANSKLCGTPSDHCRRAGRRSGLAVFPAVRDSPSLRPFQAH